MAVLVCQSQATADGRYAVGRFSDPIARALLDPADRLIVDRVRADRVPTEAAERIAYEMVRRTGLTMVPRTISIDEAIRGHAARPDSLTRWQVNRGARCGGRTVCEAC